MHCTSAKPKLAAKPEVIFFCSNNLYDPPNNGAILNISQIIKAVMSLAAEAVLGALYIHACKAIPLQHLLEEMGYKQPPMHIQTDNSTALGVVTNNIQPRCTKAMDMWYHWLCNRKNTKQIQILLAPLTNQLHQLLDEASLHSTLH
jgi:hypothetical protein